MAKQVWEGNNSIPTTPSSIAQTAAPLTGDTSPALTNLQKITLIQKVIDEEIRPILAEDGGDMELFDIEGDVVKVILKGACSGCASSTETLKIAIEATLKDRVSPSLTVESV